MDEGITILVPLPRNMAQYGADAVWDFLPCFWASSLDYSIVPVQLTCCALLEFCMHTLLQWLRFFQHIHLELFVVGALYRECQRGLSLCQGDTLLWIRSHSLWGSIHLVLMALLVLVYTVSSQVHVVCGLWFVCTSMYELSELLCDENMLQTFPSLWVSSQTLTFAVYGRPA